MRPKRNQRRQVLCRGVKFGEMDISVAKQPLAESLPDQAARRTHRRERDDFVKYEAVAMLVEHQKMSEWRSDPVRTRIGHRIRYRSRGPDDHAGAGV